MKKILLLIPILGMLLYLGSCGKNDKMEFEDFVKAIYDSEQVIAGYNETNTILDGDFEVYNKTTNFKIERGENVKSEVKIIEKKLSSSGKDTYDETETNYTTFNNTKYTVINGTKYENEYEMPTYYLTFVLSKEFLKDDYKFVQEEDTYTLTADVLDNKVSSLFLNKSLKSVKDLSIEIVVSEGNLRSFKANYKSTTGFDVKIDTEYLYANVGEARAVFYLEGGTCQNSKDRVSYVYKFDGNKIDTLIIDPNVLETEEQDQIYKTGYHIEGWYKTKTVDADGNVTYSDKWDFANGRMTLDGVTLYAKWEINRYYSYELYYYDKDGKEVFLDSYECNEGEKFYDLFLDKKEVEGYTSLGYLDSEGNPWNKAFTHPGGDSDLAIKVYLDLIEGEYTLVETYREFRSAVSRNENIYLLGDIDFDGKEMCFDDYSGEILGNGYKMINLTVDYNTLKSGLKGELNPDGTLDNSSRNTLYIALFFELKDVTIKDLTFENLLIDVDTSLKDISNIVIAPLAIIAENVKLDNVHISGNIKYSKLPDKEINLNVVNDKFFIHSDDIDVADNCTIEVEKDEIDG